ncbi:TPA: hypothetical protein ACH3X2_012840 [Trebouxia sp. C0005]
MLGRVTPFSQLHAIAIPLVTAEFSPLEQPSRKGSLCAFDATLEQSRQRSRTLQTGLALGLGDNTGESTIMRCVASRSVFARPDFSHKGVCCERAQVAGVQRIVHRTSIDFQLPMQTTASARQNADRGSLVDSIALHKTGIDEHIIHQGESNTNLLFRYHDHQP